MKISGLLYVSALYLCCVLDWTYSASTTKQPCMVCHDSKDCNSSSVRFSRFLCHKVLTKGGVKLFMQLLYCESMQGRSSISRQHTRTVDTYQPIASWYWQCQDQGSSQQRPWTSSVLQAQRWTSDLPVLTGSSCCDCWTPFPASKMCSG